MKIEVKEPPQNAAYQIHCVCVCVCMYEHVRLITERKEELGYSKTN